MCGLCFKIEWITRSFSSIIEGQFVSSAVLGRRPSWRVPHCARWLFHRQLSLLVGVVSLRAFCFRRSNRILVPSHLLSLYRIPPALTEVFEVPDSVVTFRVSAHTRSGVAMFGPESKSETLSRRKPWGPPFPRGFVHLPSRALKALRSGAEFDHPSNEDDFCSDWLDSSSDSSSSCDYHCTGSSSGSS
jgi:hypothetical protein